MTKSGVATLGKWLTGELRREPRATNAILEETAIGGGVEGDKWGLAFSLEYSRASRRLVEILLIALWYFGRGFSTPCCVQLLAIPAPSRRAEDMYMYIVHTYYQRTYYPSTYYNLAHVNIAELQRHSLQACIAITGPVTTIVI
jgi:hypothetical protein